MVRIDRLTQHDRLTLRIAGRLTQPWLDELRAALQPATGSPIAAIDLTDLAYLDAECASELLAAQARGVELSGHSPFIAGLLELHGATCA